MALTQSPLPTLFIIPTGIGCAIGGYAGDAIPSARLIAAASGCLITHPNVMNAASLFWNDERIQYVEGYSIDRFATGEIALRPVRQQKIGLLFDKAIEKELLQRHLQVIDACRASLGLNIGPIVFTECSLEICLKQGLSGISWGEIKDPEQLLRAGEELKRLGATAIAVVTRFPDESTDSDAIDAYRLGDGVDVLAGAESVISHLLVRHLTLPCAHAPALLPLPSHFSVDPRVASEEIGHTFLPSVLVGLNRAPDLIPINEGSLDIPLESNFIRSEHLGAVVVPQGAMGGEASLACLEKGVPLIEVCNSGTLGVTAEKLGFKNHISGRNSYSILHANNYLEAAGLILSIREGISIESTIRPIKSCFDYKGISMKDLDL